uniref:Putative ovule protein n=1 Tax=Solanum chacoense TaxID=4108 RepID=A0A0V0HL43_SOLCH
MRWDKVMNKICGVGWLGEQVETMKLECHLKLVFSIIIREVIYFFYFPKQNVLDKSKNIFFCTEHRNKI